MATLSILTPGTSVPPRNALTDEDFLIRFFMPSAEYPARGFSREYQRHYYLIVVLISSKHLRNQLMQQLMTLNAKKLLLTWRNSLRQ